MMCPGRNTKPRKKLRKSREKKKKKKSFESTTEEPGPAFAGRGKIFVKGKKERGARGRRVTEGGPTKTPKRGNIVQKSSSTSQNQVGISYGEDAKGKKGK